jgi:hypothetical protein
VCVALATVRDILEHFVVKPIPRSPGATMNVTLSDTMTAFLAEIGAGVGTTGELLVDRFDYQANPFDSAARSTFTITDVEWGL